MSYVVSWWSGSDQVLPDPCNLGDMGAIAAAHAVFKEAMESLYRMVKGRAAADDADLRETSWYAHVRSFCDARQRARLIAGFGLRVVQHPDGVWEAQLRVSSSFLPEAARLDVFLKVAGGAWEVSEVTAAAQRAQLEIDRE